MRTLTREEFIEWARQHSDVAIGDESNVCRCCPVARFVQSVFNTPEAKTAMGGGVFDGRDWRKGEEDFLCDDALRIIENRYNQFFYDKKIRTIGAFLKRLDL